MKIILLLLICLSIYSGCNTSDVENAFEFGSDILDLLEEEQKNVDISSLSRTYETSLGEVYFCPKDSCDQVFLTFLSSAESSISCAFYELDDESVSDLMIEKNTEGIELSLVIDDRYIQEKSVLDLLEAGVEVKSDVKRGTRYNNYMHHKFCILDGNHLLLSSANPTENGLFYNNNNLLVLDSYELAQEFQKEFNQLYLGNFGDNKIRDREIQGIISKNETLDVYFCPNDGCENVLFETLNMAEEEIVFATFVLTLDSVEEVLLKKNSLGVHVQGVIENRMYGSKGSRAEELEEIFNLTRDSNPKTMHHKFFVVDSRYVVTGSMNPSSSGVNYNDEFMLVIDSEEIAQEYRDEFFSLAG